MPLDEYRRKRDFTQTPEPSGDAERGAAWDAWETLPHGQRFCCQMHRATRFHIDFRIEYNGVLLSWAVPRGPSLDPKDKRLAVRTEDHPIDYGDFEGIIPSGYGMGTVLLWDIGTYEWTRESAEDPDRQLTKGDVKFRLQGTKLNGEFALVKIGGRNAADDQDAWLMIKKRDEAVIPDFDARSLNVSVRSGRSLEEIAAEGGGDPRELARSRRANSQPRRVAADAGQGPTSVSDSTRAENQSEGQPPSAPQTALSIPTFAPMLATAVDKPFSREGWLFELKYDGVRVLITIADGHVTLTARSGRDETLRYPEAVRIPRLVKARTAVIDCEIVALDGAGRDSFETLQQRINISRPSDVARMAARVPVSFACFDILYLDGRDLTSTALRIRKKTLHDVVTTQSPLLYADHVERDGEAFFSAIKQQGLEGMVGKRADSPYRAGRSSDWLKVKAWQSQSCVIIGSTAGHGRRAGLGALILAVREGNEWRHCGQVGTGFTQAMLSELTKQLELRRAERSPVQPPPATVTAATWARAEIVCEVRHSGWTKSGVLRHPAFLGLRPDIRPEDCVREQAQPLEVALSHEPAAPAPIVVAASHKTSSTAESPGVGIDPRPDMSDLEDALTQLSTLKSNDRWEIGGRTLRLSNLDKVLWPADGITKREMIAYYVRMAPYLLPYLRNRPLSMQVFPDGIDGKSFWRKDKPAHAPNWMDSWTYHGEKTKEYIVVNEVATLAWAANAAVVDLHPWHSRIDAPLQPDWAVFDLDPFEPATFADVVDVARLVKQALDHFGLHAVAKVTGQTGLQIYVPIRRGPDYSAVRGWVEDVGRAIGRVMPDLISWEWSVGRRGGKIRIDYTQNIINKTLAAPYSLRPMRGAPVSAPIGWDELDDPELRPDRWNMVTIFDRVAEVGDLFVGALLADQDLPVTAE